MILKFTHNIRLNKDGNISLASERVVDGVNEAEEAGKDFAFHQKAHRLLRSGGAQEAPSL
jgi:hypothetical protein